MLLRFLIKLKSCLNLKTTLLLLAIIQLTACSFFSNKPAADRRKFIPSQDSTFIGAWGAMVSDGFNNLPMLTVDHFKLILIYSKNNKFYVSPRPYYFDTANKDELLEIQNHIKSFEPVETQLKSVRSSFTEVLTDRFNYINDYLISEHDSLNKSFIEDNDSYDLIQYYIDKNGDLVYRNYYPKENFTSNIYIYKPYNFKTIKTVQEQK